MQDGRVSGQERRLGDFSHVDGADSGDLVARLDAMHTLDSFRRYKAETFALMRLRAGAAAADVGCGTGEDAARLAAQVGETGRVVGFDLSEAMLEQARERHVSAGNLSFIASAAGALSAPDESFDAIRADRVLIHTPDPKAALADMIRVLKPGGRVVISEPDMPACWVAASDYDLTDQVMRQIAQSCAWPYLPRDLWAMFKDAGLTEVTLGIAPVIAFDPAQVGRILDFQGVLKAMLAKGLLSQAQVEGWISEFIQRGETGRFAAGVPIFIAAGTKT